MYLQSFLSGFCLLFLQINAINACKGCVNLDELSFAKILPHFDVTLIKFDVAFPYGDKHEIFTKFATEVAENKDILMAEVGIKDYGEKDNEDFARRYGISKTEYPAVKLFKKSDEAPVTFPHDLEFNLNNLREFVRDNSHIYLGLPGCVEVFDKLARDFVASDDQQTILENANKLEDTIEEKHKDSAKTYLIVMKKIMEHGTQFIDQEKQRVNKLLKGKISSKKQVELNSKLNILRAFSVPINKDEL